ncbi:phospholipase DDHD1-like isoform X2 [Bufo gargarizans]|uniref:phospholipase DDHD1-like isoform X2 n=1 Tax=Bufo gargarizans TaxID=30331 RepID=UPI001CF44251|nr:phospholipase DDHD1-like isoform X2 [Bufo gargarizans]
MSRSGHQSPEKNGECDWGEEEEEEDGEAGTEERQERRRRRRPSSMSRGLELHLTGHDFPPVPGLAGSPSEGEDVEDSLQLPGRRRTRSSSSRPRYEIVTELGAEEVRWFYREEKKSWKPFIGYDSLRIELAYRRLLELSAAPEGAAPEPGEAAGLDVVNIGDVAKIEPVCVRSGLYEVDVTEGECYPVYWNQSDKIPVMRGQWFIDGTWQPLDEDESNQIEQEHLACFRGQKMHDHFDLEVAKPVDHKDVIYHLAPFSLPFLFNWRGYNESTGAPCAKRTRYEAVHSLKLSRNHVDWHSVDEVYLYSDATTSKIARTVTQKLGFSKVYAAPVFTASSSGTRLHRGYVEEATYEDKPVDTTHIVFVVHGIGQKMDQGRIIKNTAMMRETARKIEEKHFSNQTSEHVEFLPVEWRSKLALDGDTVDSITPDKVRGIRDMLNSSAMDIMYYTSPLYRDELVKGLQQELNRLYNLFCSRNPEFKDGGGKVSIVSHSLGCVITYDIMTGWNPVYVYEQVDQDEEPEDQWISYEEQHLLRELCLTKQRLKELEDRLHGLKTPNSPVLKFKVENFFCMGSPLAVFLALRGIRPGNRGTQDQILPRAICNRLFNVFHPADPVAYRLEPLILKHYSNVSPVQIHSSNTTNPILYKHVRPCLINPSKDTTSMSDTESIPSPSTSPVLPRRHYGESITNIGKASILGAASIGKGLGGMLFSRFARSSATTAQGYEVKDSADGEDKKSVQSTATSQSIPHSISGSLDTVDLEHRIDFELREGLVESRYWSAMTSHTAYWSSMDVALFLLTFLYKDGQLDEEDKLGVDEL